MDIPFKLTLIGTQKVGKTSLLSKFHFGTFEKNTVATVGASFVVHRFSVLGKDYQFQIWDTAGQERYRSLGPIYYRDASCALSVFDLTSIESFEEMKIYINQFKLHCSNYVHIAIIGNKLDLIEEKSTIETDKIQNWAKKEGFSFHLTSALTGEGVNHMFQSIAEIVTSLSSNSLNNNLNNNNNNKNSCC